MRLKELIHTDRKLTGSFYDGFISYFTAIKVVTTGSGYLKYFVVPFFLNLLILTSIVYYSFSVFHPWVMSFIQGDAWFFTFLRLLLAPILIFVTVIIAMLIYSIVGSIICAPFNDFLSLKVEREIGDESFDEKFFTFCGLERYAEDYSEPC